MSVGEVLCKSWDQYRVILKLQETHPNKPMGLTIREAFKKENSKKLNKFNFRGGGGVI